MNAKDPSKPSIDPRLLVEVEGLEGLARLLGAVGYIAQGRILVDLRNALRSRKPLLVEGPRGGGKTALAEDLAKACNLAVFYLQGMDDLTISDVLYWWDREAQTQMVKQEIEAGASLRAAQAKQFTRDYLIPGEALGAFEYAGAHDDVPILIIDEADKLKEKVEDMLLQLLGRGWAHVPRYGDVGVRDPQKWPIVFLLSNDIRHDLSAPLRSRCIYTWLELPTPAEEVAILRKRVPAAGPDLLAGVVKIINHIRHDMPHIRDKPGIREARDLLEILALDGIQDLTADVIAFYVGFLGKRRKTSSGLIQSVSRLAWAAKLRDAEIDGWVRQSFAKERIALEEAPA